ncbi:MAG: ATP-binding protein [Candidatus Dojkabacteria bacterium]
MQTIRNSEAELKQIEAQLGTFPGFKKANLDELATILQGLMQRIKLAQEVIQDLEKDLAKTGESERLNYLQVSEQKQRGRDLLQLGGGGAAVGFVGFVVGVILSSLIIQILSAFLLIPGILVFFWGLVKSSGSSVISVSEGVESAEVRSLREQIVSQKERVELAKKEQQEIISQYGLEDSNQFFTQKARFAALKSEYERVQAVLSSQLGDKTAMQWQEEESKLLAQKKEIETNLLTEEVRAAALSPNDYLRQRRDLDMLLIERRKLEKDTTKNEIISETVTVSEEEINRLEEKKEILEQRLGNLNKRAAVLSKTIDYLEQVIKQTSKGASELVAQIAEQFLPRLTENRYKDIRLNENYDLEVFSSEKNDWVKPLDTLSLGTADQIYILARVALAKTILGGSLPYLFLDDPFVTFDSVRLGQMKEILQELASETQIFLFTHGEHYKDWGNLVEL